MDYELRGRIALITGGSRGIGAAVAHSLGAEGARLAISARNQASLDDAIARLREAGMDATGFQADVSEAGEVARLFEEVRAELGEPEILVVNAGGPPAGLPSSLSEEEWARGFELTLMSAVRLTYEALPAMRSAGWGRIINITSFTVKQPVLNLALSNSFRAAVTGFAKTLSTEVAADGVTVNNVGPGYTATERLEELFVDEAAKERLLQSIPAKRFGTPEEIASLVAYLASRQAGYITGQTIVPDGGVTAGLL